MNPQMWWYVSRASGIVAWLMLTGSVLWGIFLTTDLFPRRRRAAWLLDLHRWLAGLTVFFLAAHLGALLADSHAHFGARSVLVPFGSVWRPTAIALGVFGLYLLLAVELTALAMRKLPRKWWRDVHIASYAVFWLACIHSALAGTDTSQPLYTITSIVALAAIVFALSYRLLTRDLPKRKADGARGRDRAPASARTPAPASARARR
jgi:methionine sulfoxide reductase heme-binding subunit